MEYTYEELLKKFEKKQQNDRANSSKYYKKNKQQIKDKSKVICKCACGGSYTRSNRSNHLKTKKHLKSI